MTEPTAREAATATTTAARVAVVGVGWWSQGWHLPFLHTCPDVELIAIVDPNPHPKSNLNPNMESLTVLAERYNNCHVYATVEELLEAKGTALHGILLATPHATHYEIAKQIMTSHPHIHICMEKPLTTDVNDATKLLQLVRQRHQQQQQVMDSIDDTSTPPSSSSVEHVVGTFMINHSANYTSQARQARDIITSGTIGTIQHISASFASPLRWLFEDPSNKGWNEPTHTMVGNGFSWGQMCHLIGWILHAVPTLVPTRISCDMIHSTITGADLAVTASVKCYHQQRPDHQHNHDRDQQTNDQTKKDDDKTNEDTNSIDTAIMSLSGTTLLPGWEHGEDNDNSNGDKNDGNDEDEQNQETVGKRIHIEIYGTQGALFYSGTDDRTSSGKLVVLNSHGKRTVINDEFVFEQLDYTTGQGPESLRSWIAACQGRHDDCYIGADCELGLKTVQIVAAMYESNHQQIPINV